METVSFGVDKDLGLGSLKLARFNNNRRLILWIKEEYEEPVTLFLVSSNYLPPERYRTEIVLFNAMLCLTNLTAATGVIFMYFLVFCNPPRM